MLAGALWRSGTKDCEKEVETEPEEKAGSATCLALIPMLRSGYYVQSVAGRSGLGRELEHQTRIAAAKVEVNLRYSAVSQIENDFRTLRARGVVRRGLLIGR